MEPGTVLIRYKKTEFKNESEAVSIEIKSISSEMYIPTIVMSKKNGYKSKFQMKLLNTNGAKLTCTTSNPKVATVNSKGVITARSKKGKAKITINIERAGHKVQYVLNVKAVKKLDNYSLIKYKTTYKNPSVALYKLVPKGNKYRIQLKNVSKDAKITYKSSKKKIASVDKKGVVRGLKSGRSDIMITINESGKSYQYYMVIRVTEDDTVSKTSYLKKLK